MQAGIFGLVNNTHPATAQLFNDAIVAEHLTDKRIVTRCLGGHGEEPLPPSPLAGIVGLEFGEVNQERRTNVARPFLSNP
jgi:hypothetical protein